jgi:hypothetical protein
VTSREETADGALHVAADVERLWVVNANAFRTETEPSDAVNHDGLAIGQAVLHHVFKFCYYCYHIAPFYTTVGACFLCQLAKGYFTCAYCLCEILAIAAATLDVVLY